MAILRVLRIVVGLETMAALAFCALRLSSALPVPPAVDLDHDGLTGEELLSLPDRFLFDSAVKWRTLGEAYMAHGYFSKAEACLARAVESEPSAAETAYLLGLCRERLGLLPQARAALARVVNCKNPELRAAAWHHVGRIQLRREHPEAAAEAFKRAGDAHYPSVYERAKLIVRGGRAREAERLLQILIHKFPHDLRVWQLQARAADAWGNAREAAMAREKAERGILELVLDDTEARLEPWRRRTGMARELEAARQRLREGLFAAAAGRYRRLVDEVPRWQNGQHLLLEDAAYAHLQAGDPRGAAALLRRQFDEFELPTADAWELRGDLAALDGNLQAALEAWNTAAEIRPVAGVHAKLARLHEAAGRLDTAHAHLARARLLEGAFLVRNNQLAVARAPLQEALSLNPGLAEAWYFLAESERLQGRATQARAAYTRCLALAPHHGRARSRLESDGVRP